jgi:hypothetical protein
MKDLVYIQYVNGEAFIGVNCTSCGDRILISLDDAVEAAVILGENPKAHETVSIPTSTAIN